MSAAAHHLSLEVESVWSFSTTNPVLNTTYIDFKGYINVSPAQAGTANFSLNSDDYAQISIDGALLPNTSNIGGATDSVVLDSGVHTIELQYVNQALVNGVGGAHLSVSGTFQSNGDAIIPTTQSTNSSAGSGFQPLYQTATGSLAGSYYALSAGPSSVASAQNHEITSGIPQATFASTILQGTIYNGYDPSHLQDFLGADGPKISSNPDTSLQNAYLDISGNFNVSASQAGIASFTLAADDGAVLSVDYQQVVNLEGNHLTLKKTGTTAQSLTVGSHHIEIQYYNASTHNNSNIGGAFLSLSGNFADGEPVLPAESSDPFPYLYAPDPANGGSDSSISAKAGTAFTSAPTNGIVDPGKGNFANATLRTAGLYQLQIAGQDDQYANDSAPATPNGTGISIPGVTSGSFFVLPGKATGLSTYTPSSTVTAGQPFSEGKIYATDQYGNYVDGNLPVTATLSLPAEIADAGFESPSVNGGFQYQPTGSPWTFSARSGLNAAGINANGTAYTSGNPATPDGGQVAFIQGTGSITQTFNFPAAGNYTLGFLAAHRATDGSTFQTIQVLVDGRLIDTFTSFYTSYLPHSTPSFAVTAGQHSIEFLGTNPSGDDHTTLIDSITEQAGPNASDVTAPILDPGFESDSLGSGAFTYAPSGSAWTFSTHAGSDGAGLSSNGSGFTSGNPGAPEGTQVAFVQDTGWLSEPLSFPVPGLYTLNVLAAQRQNVPSAQSIDVLVNGVEVGRITPSGTTYMSYSTPAFAEPAGTYSVEFLGTNGIGDNTAFIDSITERTNASTSNLSATVADPGFEAPSVAAATNHYMYSPSGSPWSFSTQSTQQGVYVSGAGFAGNGSTVFPSHVNAPEGTQVAFVEGTGWLSQPVSFPASGTYTLSFLAVAAAGSVSSSEEIEVEVDGAIVGTVKPSGTAFTSYTTGSFAVSAGSQVLEFLGANNTNSAFGPTDLIDSISVGGTTTTSVAVNGVATFPDLVFQAAGTYALLASADGASTTTGVNVVAGAASQLSVSQTPGPALAGATLGPLQVLVEDQDGNVATTSTASVTVSSADGAGPTTVSAVKGVATFSNLVPTTAGTSTFTASSTGLASATSDPVTVSANATVALVVLTGGPASATSGTTLAPVQVGLEDSYGNLITSASGSVALTVNGPGVLAGTSTVNAVNGVATFSSLVLQTAGTYTPTARSGSITTATPLSVVVSPGTVASLGITQVPTKTTTAGQPLSSSVLVTLWDAYNNVVTTSTDVVSLAVNGTHSFTPESVLVAAPVLGVVTFPNLVLDTAGSYTLTASTASLTSPASSSFKEAPAGASQLAIVTAPATATAGISLSPLIHVLVEDQFGNQLTTSSTSVSLTLNGPGNFVGGTPTAMTSSGDAKFSGLILNTAGNYGITATSTGLANSPSTSLLVAPTTANKLVFGATPGTAATGQALNPAVVVDVEDLYGNLVTTSSASVALTATPSGGQAGAATTLNAVNGVATFPNLVLATAGSYTLAASAGSLTAAKTGAFDVTPGITVSLTGAFSAMQGQSTGTQALATFRAVGASTDPAAYSATVSWGDGKFDSSGGTNSPVTIAVTNGMVTVSGNHVFQTSSGLAHPGMAYPVVTLGYLKATVPTAPGAIAIDVAADLTTGLSAAQGPFHGNPITRLTTGTLTLTNTTSGPLSGPFRVLLAGLPSTAVLQSATLLNAGTTTALTVQTAPSGVPLLAIPGSIASLAAGGSFQIGLTSSNPTNGAISYSPRVFSDPNAPAATTVPPIGTVVTSGGVRMVFGANSTLTSFTLGNVTFTSTNLRAVVTPPPGGTGQASYRIFGAAVISGVANLTGATVQFGTNSANAGVVITNGSLGTVAGTLTGLTVPGGSLAARTSLTLGYSTANSGTFTISGDALLTAGPLTLAIPLPTSVGNGLSIQNGVLTQVGGTLSGSISLGGLAFDASALTVTDSNPALGAFTIKGTTTVTDPSLTGGPSLTAVLGGTVPGAGQPTAGLVISGSTVTLDSAMTGSFTLDGASFDASALEIVYAPANNGTYTLSGKTDIKFPSFAGLPDLPLTLGTAGAGLQLMNGVPQPFGATATASVGAPSLGGYTFSTAGLAVAFSPANAGTFTVTGAATLTDPAVSSDPSLPVVLGGKVNNVATAGLMISGGSFSALGASVSGPFVLGGMSVAASGLTLAYTTAAGGTFAIAGSTTFTTPSIATLTITAQLGSGSDIAGSSLEIQNGVVQPFSVGCGASVVLAGVTVSNPNLNLAYATDNGGSYEVTGHSGLNIPGLQGFHADLDFEVVAGQLDHFDASVIAGFTVAGMTFNFEQLQLVYTASNDTFAITGNAFLPIRSAGVYLDIDFGGLTADGVPTPGIVVRNGQLTHFDASVSANIKLAGGAGSIQIVNLDFQYSPANGGFFSVAGNASVSSKDHSVEIAVDLGGQDTIDTVLHQTAGIVISGGDLTKFDGIVKSTQEIQRFGLTLDDTDLGVSYLAATATDPHSHFSLFGTATVSTLGGIVNHVAADFGDDPNSPGLVLQDWSLQTLNLTLHSGGITLGPTSLAFNELGVSYDPAHSYLQVTGGATLSLGSVISGTVTLPDSGLTINTKTGAVQVDGLDLSVTVSPGAVDFTTLSVLYRDVAGTITIDAGGSVQLEPGLVVNGELDFSNGVLQEIELGYEQSPGIPVGASGFYITSLSGAILNPGTSTVVVSASVGLTFGESVLYEGSTYALFTEVGTVTISSTELDIVGTASMVGGLLGTGTASMDLSWSSAAISSMTIDLLGFGGQAELSGNLTLRDDPRTGYSIGGSEDFQFGRIPGVSVPLIDANGTLLINGSLMSVTGNVSVAGGTLGQGFLDVNWGSTVADSVAFDYNLGTGAAAQLDLSGSLAYAGAGISGTASFTAKAGSSKLITAGGAVSVNSKGLDLSATGTLGTGNLGSIAFDVALDWGAGNYRMGLDAALPVGLGRLDGTVSVATSTATVSGSAELTLGQVSSSSSLVDLTGAFSFNTSGLSLTASGSLFGMDLGTSIVTTLAWGPSTERFNIAGQVFVPGVSLGVGLYVNLVGLDTSSPSWAFGGTSSIAFGIDAEVGPIDIPGSKNFLPVEVDLGSIHLQAGFSGTITVSAGSGNGTGSFSLGLGGGFTFEGTRLSVPSLLTLPLSASPGTFAALAGQAVDAISADATSLFSSFYTNNLGQWTSDIKSGILAGASDIGRVLDELYHQTEALVAADLQDAGQTLSTIAGVLTDEYLVAKVQVASALRTAGYLAGDVAAALKSDLSLAASDVVGVLTSAGYTLDQAAGALQSAYNQSARQVVQILKSLSYDLTSVSSAVQDVFNLVDPADLYAVLHGAGYVAGDIQTFFSSKANTIYSAFVTNAFGSSSVFNPSSWG